MGVKPRSGQYFGREVYILAEDFVGLLGNAPPSEGTKIGPYEVIGLIGQGGMGEVWQARDTGSRTALEAAPPPTQPFR